MDDADELEDGVMTASDPFKDLSTCMDLRLNLREVI